MVVDSHIVLATFGVSTLNSLMSILISKIERDILLAFVNVGKMHDWKKIEIFFPVDAFINDHAIIIAFHDGVLFKDHWTHVFTYAILRFSQINILVSI
jgi:hypothetical protein